MKQMQDNVVKKSTSLKVMKLLFMNKTAEILMMKNLHLTFREDNDITKKFMNEICFAQ